MKHLRRIDMNNDLTKLLPYYIALQPKFREVMGPYQIGDEYGYPGNPCNNFVREEDLGRCRRLPKDTNVYCLPRTIDDSSEEARKRSLVGMINGAITLRRNYALRDYNLIVATEHDVKIFVADTPTLAILKALSAQWEVEG
jgi:hypothetical protein